MEQVTNYVQQAVNVPVTQYRAVYSTKYVQMQPGATAYAMPTRRASWPGCSSRPAMPAAPAAAVRRADADDAQAWGSAGSDIPQQVIQGQTSIAAPTLPQGFVPQAGVSQPVMPQPTFQQQQIVPQSGTYATPAPVAPGLQPTAPPALQPAPSLKPIPETPALDDRPAERAPAQRAPAPYTAPPPVRQPDFPAAPSQPAPAAAGRCPAAAPRPARNPAAAPATGPATMPVVPGDRPRRCDRHFPRLLEPTSHTTSWQPAPIRPTSYPTAALPGRVQ